MSKLTIKSGKGQITLRKSNSLVGVKTGEDASEKEFVEDRIIKNLGGFEVVTLKDGAGTVDRNLDKVRERDDVEVGTHVYFAEGSNKPLVPTGEIYIVFEDGVSEGEQQTVLDEFALEVVERRSDQRVVARVTANSPNPIKVGAALQASSLVKIAEPDIDTVMDEYFMAPNDNLLPNEWHLQNDGYVVDNNFRLRKGADAKVVDAWRRLGNTGSSDIVIAVIDNGFDLGHPDLKDKVFRPFDLWRNSSNVLQGDPRFTHGTPCASVALAASNGQGIVGAAPNAKFMPLSGTSFSVRATEDMFNYCIKYGADIISCSWGTTDANYSLSPIKEEAITRATRNGRNGKGCVVIFAAGNDNLDYVNFYGAHPDVICVAASTSQDTYASYSNRGREVTVCAPSNGDWPIIAARAWWDPGITNEVGEYKYWRDGRSRGSRYKHFGGTSSSTPLVAGICALMLSANPDLTGREVKDILKATADKIGSSWEYDGRGHSRKYGYGRVNADRAVAEALRRKEKEQPVVPPAEVSNSVSTGQGLFRFDVAVQPAQGYGVQIGAFSNYGNVLEQSEKMRRQFGQPVIVNVNQINGRTVYKVVAGNFRDKNEALSLLSRLKAAGINGFVRNLADLA